MQLLKLPLSIPMGFYKRDTKKNKIGEAKKPFRLNLNVWRNANRFERTLADTNFRQYIKDNFKLKPIKQILVIYCLYVGSNRKSDILNVTSIVDKYFMDTLQEMNVIEDDNYSYYPISVSMFSGVDRDNEHINAYLFDISAKTKQEVGKIVSEIIEKELSK